MAENIILLDVNTDPFKADSPELKNVQFGQENLVLVEGIYHKTQKIKFLKSVDIAASDILTGEIRTYLNSKIMAPISSQEVNTNTPSGTPTYEFKTVRNRELDFILERSELERRMFYSDEQESLGQRNIVFDSNTPMVGVPKPQITGPGSPQLYNSIYMTYAPMGGAPGQRNISEYLNNVDDDYNLNIFERFQVLVGHYSNAIKTRNNADRLTLKMVFDDFDHPFPVDAYYTISNKDVDLSYEPLQQEAFLEGILESLSKKTMNYEDIFNGKQNPNEVLFFRIEKWFSETPTGTPNQVFFVPATDDNKLFIDTQIQENQQYYYRVTAYYAAIAQEYFFSNIDDDGDVGSCTVEVRPKTYLYNQMIIEGNLFNISPPPLPPFVSFHNKISSEGKMKIFLELQRNTMTGNFIPILNLEEPVISTNSMLPNGEIEFKYTKEAARFEVFRTTKKPKSYGDFSDSFIGFFENTNMSENMIILDNIRPNRKYYYTFRTVNKFDSFSNPSPVYEVELLKDADESRILVNSILFSDVTFPTEMNVESSLNFRSLLKINVAPQQLNFNVDNLREPGGGPIDTFENQVLGITLGNFVEGEELVNKIWGRKFKFRVRSNDSGKIIDFNVKVNLTKEEDFPV